MTPKISVAMSVFNGEEYLRAAIDSILAQTFSDFEFIIVDDGSTDRSAAIVRGYDDPRFVLLSQENRGVAAALNHAMSRARGEYIARQDADDVSLPERFAQQVQWLEAHPEVSALGTGAVLIDPQGRPFSRVNPSVYAARAIGKGVEARNLSFSPRQCDDSEAGAVTVRAL
jgi:glycosyltransferase involved in cell wall biosynthesis